MSRYPVSRVARLTMFLARQPTHRQEDDSRLGICSSRISLVVPQKLGLESVSFLQRSNEREQRSGL